MAKKFLTSIDLSKCELINARIHNLASAPGSPVDGQIYFNTGDGQMYFYDGSVWQSMRGDITSVTLTGGAGASVTQSNSNGGAYTATIDVNVDTTTIGINGSDNLYVIKDSQYLETFYNTDGSFTSARTATLGANNLTFNATGAGKFTIQNTLYVGQQSAGGNGQIYIYAPDNGLGSGITWDDGTAPTGKIKFQHNVGDFIFEIGGTELFQFDGTTGSVGLKINKGSLVASTYALDVTANSGADVARLEGMLESTSETKFVTISTGGVLKYRTVTGINGSGAVENLGNTNLAVTAGESRTFTINDGRTDAFKISDADGALLNFNTTGATVVDKVATFGTSVVIDGNLTVSGTTTTISTETVTIADNIIVLNSNAAGAATESAGFEIERGTDTNVQFLWNETNDYWSAVGTKLHVGVIETTASTSVLVETSGVIEKRTLSGMLDTLTFAGNSGTAVPTGGTITFSGANGVNIVAAGNVVAVSGVDATTTTKGVASFAAADFDVAAGAVSLEDTVVKTVTTDSGALTPSSHGFSILGGEGMDVTHTGTTITVAGEDATTTNKGIVELATGAETNALTDTARAVTPASLASLRYAETGSGSATSWAVNHNLSSTDVIVQLYQVSTGDTVECDVTRTSVDTVTLGFCTTQDLTDLRVLVIKIA